MRIQSCLIRNGVLCSLSLSACLLWSAAASAEVTLVEKGGWSFFSDGRVNSFLSLGFGDDFPPATPNPDGAPHVVIGDEAIGAAGQNTMQDNAANKYFAARVRNGFVGTVLAFGVKRNITPTTTVKSYIALWGHAEVNDRNPEAQVKFDVRQGYVEFDGPWGNFQAGRALGLFGRTSTDIDFLYGHNYGLGYPCGDKQGPTCGHIGTGVMFPGFAAGFVYTTPSLGGLKLAAGLYDPVRVLGAWGRAPILRPEVQLSYEQKIGDVGMFKLGAEGLYQPVGRQTTNATDPTKFVDLTDSVWGAAAGGRLEVGPVRFGASYFRGKGLGQYYALQNSPVVFNPRTYEIRYFTGLYAQSALVLGKTQFSLGAGRVWIDQLDADKTDTSVSNAKSHMGISAAVYYAMYTNFVLGIDYFRFQADWWGAPDADMAGAPVGGYLAPEKQVVSYINVGATFHW